MAKTDVIVDTSFFVTMWLEAEPRHDEAWTWYEREPARRFVTTPVVLGEMDHLLRKYGGRAAERIVASHIATRALEVDWWDGGADAIWKVVDGSPGIGVADASLVALAARCGTTDIATYDERHFRTLKPLTGEDRFTLLPADAD